MTTETQSEKEFLRLGYTFIEEFKALISDFYDISEDKTEQTKSLFKSIKNKNSENQKIQVHEILEINHSSLKHSQFRIAMFNYMNAIFERNINELLRLGFIKNQTIRKKYIEKFISLDTQRIQQNQKSIRNAEFELMSSEDKNKIYLNFFKEVTETLPPLLNYQHFFAISDKNMWNDKSLRFDFNEIRSRRNLLTHRGVNYDNEYVDKIIKSAPASNNFIDPKKRIQFYFDRKFFFINPNFDSIVKNEIKNLVTENKLIPAEIGANYFVFSFTRLITIYCKLWISAANSSELLINLSHDLIKLGLIYKKKILIILAISVIEDYIFCFGNEDVSDLIKANYLLAVRDLYNSYTTNNEKAFPLFKYENKFLEYFIDKTNVPIFQVLVSVLGNDLTNAVTHIKNCELSEESRNWVLFTDLLENSEFENAFNIARINNT